MTRPSRPGKAGKPRTAPSPATYEQRLDAEPRWAAAEGGRYFGESSSPHETMHRLARRLEALGVAYAIAGAMALFRHGYRRFSEDVDVLVTREGLATIHRELEGKGYQPEYPGHRSLRDTETGVRIDFVVSGDFPGDWKPTPVSFPDPATASEEHGGIRYLALPKLIELKLASGISSPSRLKDLADVIELIKALRLPPDYREQLAESVREKYSELHAAAESTPGAL